MFNNIIEKRTLKILNLATFPAKLLKFSVVSLEEGRVRVIQEQLSSF